jgi:hypothetical protein
MSIVNAAIKAALGFYFLTFKKTFMKKRFPSFLIISVFFLILKTNGQWSSNGTHIYNTNSGYVGIGMGTTIPTSPLTVFSELGLFNNGNSTTLRGNATTSASNAVSVLNIYSNTSALNGPYMTFYVKENNTPVHTGSIEIISNGLDGNGLVVGNFNPSTSLWSKHLFVKKTGQVSIGTEWPDLNYKLSVCGKIRAQEIKVETGWCDYVFKKDYKLMPLSQLKTFVNTNYHLPEIPTEKEVEKEGVSLGNMQMLQMKKIEELTLYILQLNERLEKLEAENKNLKGRIR